MTDKNDKFKPPYFAEKFISIGDYNPAYKPNRFELIKLISNVPQIDCLFYLSRLDALLGRSEGLKIDFQKDLLKVIFQDTDISRFLVNELSKKDSIFFHYQQIYYCINLLIRYGNKQYSGNISPSIIYKLGMILLYINDFFNEKPIIAANYQHEVRHIQTILWKIGMFSSYLNYDFRQELSRTYLLYINSEEGKIISKLFYKLNKIELFDFYKIIFIIYAKFISDTDFFLKENIILDKNHYFKNVKYLDQNNINIVLQLLSENIDGHYKNIESKLKAFNNETYNTFFLQEKPILEFRQNQYICLSLPYLVLRITRGLLELIRTNKLEEKDNQQLGKAIGDCYQKYIQNLLKKTFDSTITNRFYNRKFKNIEISDGIIDYGDELIFIEIKARSIQKKYKVTKDFKDIEKCLKMFLINEGAKQLDNRINEFKSGKIKIHDISRERILKFYPILITCIDEIPQFDVLTDYYHELLRNYSILISNDIAPLTILTISEFESLIDLVNSGYCLLDILKDKLSSKDLIGMSFKNFLVYKSDIYKRDKIPDFLNDRFLELYNDIFKEIKSKQIQQ